MSPTIIFLLFLTVPPVESSAPFADYAEYFFTRMKKYLEFKNVTSLFADDFQLVQCTKLVGKSKTLAYIQKRPNLITAEFTKQLEDLPSHWIFGYRDLEAWYTNKEETAIRGTVVFDGLWFIGMKVDYALVKGRSYWEWTRGAYHKEMCDYRP